MRYCLEDNPPKDIVVVKIGGSTLGSHDTTLEDLVALQRNGANLVVVHGGGSIISQWMERQGAVPRFVRGLRVTDAQSLEIVTAVLTGLVNKQLVASLISLGGSSIGISGVDGGLLEAQVADEELGYVGDVTKVNPRPLLQALKAGYMPLVAPLGLHCVDSSPYSGSLLNINGDTVAGELALAIGAHRLIFLTDVEGVMDGSGRVIPRLNERSARLLLSSGVVRGGMIPKLSACLRALERVPMTEIVDGRVPGVLMDCLTGAHTGTQVLQSRAQP
jgi:acetylglutamate kinase